MLISLLNIRLVLVWLLFLPILCNAAEAGAPIRFYEGLQSKNRNIAHYHTIKQNETLAAIANHYGYDYIDLARWNDLHSPYNLVAGQSLKLFAGNRINRRTAPSLDTNVSIYRVEKNATLSSIAARFGVSVRQLVAWNDLTIHDPLYAGQQLKIFKNKQKHSQKNSSKILLEIAENARDSSQKTSIISINNKSMLKFYCHWPTEGKIIKSFSRTGGRGIEIRGKAGQAIRATAAGTVVAVNPGIYGHGNFIVIQHSNQYLSSYLNNRRSLVRTGQKVAAGQVIAEMGQVGRKPPSLNFEIRKNGKLINPMRFLPKKI